MFDYHTSDQLVGNQISRDYGYKEGDGDNDVEQTLMMVASGVVGHYNNMAKVSPKSDKVPVFPLVEVPCVILYHIAHS